MKMRVDKESAAFAVVRIVAITLLLWAYAKHPIGYYTLLRFVVCATCAYGAYHAMKLKQIGWIWAMAFLAVLFNPIIPVYLKREHWEVIDALAAAFLLLSILLLRPSQNAGEKPNDSSKSNEEYRKSIKTILGASFWILIVCYFGYSAAGDLFNDLVLLQRGQTVKGYITDIQVLGQQDNGVIDYSYTYTYRLPTGRELTRETEHGPQDLREDLWDSEQPYPIEVEYLPDAPLTSRIKGVAFNSNSFLEWLGRKVALGGLLLAMFLSPSTKYMTKVE